jgi:hypothetical protein
MREQHTINVRFRTLRRTVAPCSLLKSHQPLTSARGPDHFNGFPRKPLKRFAPNTLVPSVTAPKCGANKTNSI